MKPIQVTILKPESEDWEIVYRLRKPAIPTWQWNGYVIVQRGEGYRFDCYVPNNGDDFSRLTLSEAQEACFQHYLKQNGITE